MPTFEDLDDSTEADVDVQSLGLDPVEPEAELEEKMSEVEMRLEKAYYYRMLLKQNPFDSDSAIADEVWKDISKLLRMRLGELLGITSTPVPIASQFTEEEAAILKAVASKLAKNATTTPKPKPKKAPGLKKVSVAEVEAPRTVQPTQAVGQLVKQEKPKAGTIVGKPGKAGAPKKLYKKHIDDTGKEVLMDLTPQVKPVGVQPMPMPAIEMANAHATMQSAQIAQTQDESLIEIVKKQ